MSDVKTFVAGHKSPDTDSICSAISYANLLTQMGTPQRLYVLVMRIRKLNTRWNISVSNTHKSLQTGKSSLLMVAIYT